jgi:hypothetical protein
MRALFWLVSFYVNPLYKYRNWNYYVLYVKLLLGNASLFNCILNVSLHYIVLKTVATVHTRLRQNVWSEHILVHDDSLNALRFNKIQSTHFSCIADLPIYKDFLSLKYVVWVWILCSSLSLSLKIALASAARAILAHFSNITRSVNH